MNEGSSYRGVIKNYAREIVVTAYGLHLSVPDADAAPSSEVQAQYARERVATLTRDCAWLMVSASVPWLVLLADASDRTRAVPSGTRRSPNSYTRPSSGGTHRHHVRNLCLTRSLW